MKKNVYLIDLDKDLAEKHLFRIDDKEWKKVAITQGNVYTINSFVYVYNWDEINQGNSLIRIL